MQHNCKLHYELHLVLMTLTLAPKNFQNHQVFLGPKSDEFSKNWTGLFEFDDKQKSNNKEELPK